MKRIIAVFVLVMLFPIGCLHKRADVQPAINNVERAVKNEAINILDQAFGIPSKYIVPMDITGLTKKEIIKLMEETNANVKLSAMNYPAGGINTTTHLSYNADMTAGVSTKVTWDMVLEAIMLSRGITLTELDYINEGTEPIQTALNNRCIASSVITDTAIVVGDGGARGVKETNVKIDSSDNVTGATSYATDKVSGVPGRLGAYEEDSTSILMTGNEGAANIAASLWFKYSNSEPTANGIMLHGVPSTGVSQRSWGYFDEVTIEVSAGIIQIKDGGVGLEKLTSITPPPIVLAEPDQLQPIDDAWPIMQFLAETYPSGVTITSIHISTSVTCTDVLNFEEWSNNGTSWSVDSTVENITLSGTHTEDDGALTDGSIAADAWLYVDLPASPTDIAYYSVVISFTVN